MTTYSGNAAHEMKEIDDYNNYLRQQHMYQVLESVHHLIQEGINGDAEALNQALALVEDIRQPYIYGGTK